MSTIRCPHCGSPVMVRGNRWECGWCGDFGDISSLNRSERIKFSWPETRHWRTWSAASLSILEGIQAHFGSGEKERLFWPASWPFTGCPTLWFQPTIRHNITSNFCRCFFSAIPSAQQARYWVQPAAENQPLRISFCLQKEQLGSFWESLLPDLPQYEAYKSLAQLALSNGGWPERCGKFFLRRGQLSTLFDALQEALDAHWSAYPLLHPDLATLGGCRPQLGLLRE